MLKSRLTFAVSFLFCIMPFAVADDTNQWDAANARPWSRESGAITVSRTALPGDTSLPNNTAETVIVVRHTNKTADWALSSGKRIAVEPGDLFELSAVVRLSGQGSGESSVVLYDANNNAICWSYSSQDTHDTNGQWVTLQSRFAIPRNVATIEPRLVGYGASTVECRSLAIHRVGKIDRASNESEQSLTLENTILRFAFDITNGTMTVTDKRMNRRWEQRPPSANSLFVEARVVERDGGKAITCRMIDQEYMKVPVNIEMRLAGQLPELCVTLDGQGKMGNRLAFPAPFISHPGERLIVPMNEGIGFPVDERDLPAMHLITYGGHGICMGFWGQVEDATGIGQMAIIETSDDGVIQLECGTDGMLQITPAWEPSMGEFRYPRKLRYVFCDKGGYVAMCKRYREHAKETGLWVPFTEKIKKNPNIDLLIGAANIWSWDNNKTAIV
ncbi:MAG: hypothetical protein FWC50_08015, partial [Planctomycetaceae bacterium]|nr:hypothetical protein [Planctomycetaceae bacterium]